jgi:tight adherence protein B
MDILIIIVGLVCIAFIAVLLALFLGWNIPGISSAKTQEQLSALVEVQRNVKEATKEENSTKRTTPTQNTKNVKIEQAKTTGLTLEKKLKYAQWKITPSTFKIAQIAISIIVAFVISFKFNILLVAYSLMSGPLFMNWLLNSFLYKRFKAFDDDYPAFLLNLVSLLKTGMNVMGAMEAAAKTLDEDSLVRIEVQLMLERLKYGVSEDKSIGSFAEDVYHEEIELFVQALLLSRRVGGTLSDTLDRLAKQVRKRQYFRSTAKGAVGMQRGSIYFILGVMVGMEVYLYFVYPEAVLGALNDSMGWQVWQVAIALILTGMWWITQVTKIRV